MIAITRLSLIGSRKKMLIDAMAVKCSGFELRRNGESMSRFGKAQIGSAQARH
jgi:hypothetical protein